MILLALSGKMVPLFRLNLRSLNLKACLMLVVDWIVIAVYFSILAGIVYWSSKRQESSDDYFLAGRNVGWFAIGASLFASNIGSEHIVGLAGAGATSGTGMAHWELHAWVMITLGWVFVPFYYTCLLYTSDAADE